MDPWMMAREEVRARADLLQVLGARGIEVRRKGSSWVARCPFHDDRNPSLHVHPEKGFYKCFVCGVGGDVFRFVQEFDKVGFKEALADLARSVGVELPARDPRTKEWGDRMSELRSLLEWARGRWHRLLLATPEVLGYARMRGLTDPEIEEFQVGFAPDGTDSLARAALGEGWTPTDLLEAGLVSEGARGILDRFRCRLQLGLNDASGRLVGFAGRNLRKGDARTPKYLNSPETLLYRKGSLLFGFGLSRRAIAERREAWIVEGYFDWFALRRHGFPHVVAASGTALTAEQASLLSPVASRARILFDADKAGADASERSIPVLLAAGVDPWFVRLPRESGVDPDEALSRHGAAVLDQANFSARTFSGFLVDRFRQSNPDASPDRRTALVRRVRELVAMAPADLRRMLAADTEVQAPLAALGMEAWEWTVSESAHRMHPRSSAIRTPATTSDWSGRRGRDGRMLSTLLAHPDLVSDLADRIHPDDLEDPRARELLDALLATAVAGRRPEWQSFSSQISQEILHFALEITERFPATLDARDAGAMLNDTLAVMTRDRERRNRQNRRQGASTPGKETHGRPQAA